ncbi:MAG: ATP-dependent helicase [Weeksellaceae bacterium]
MDVFKSLNPKQQEAVRAVVGPSVILAGAGSGKTRVLVHKVLHLVKDNNVNPGAIVMITFTNKAAKEMKERIQKVVPLKEPMGYVGTFHSFCAKILRIDGESIGLDRNYTIYDDDDQTSLLKDILKKMNVEKTAPSYFLYRISEAKNQLITPEKYMEFFSHYKAAVAAEVYYKYQKALEKNNAVDFDDLLMKTVQLLRKNPDVLNKYHNRYRYFLVDEFQDTNVAQYALTQILSQKDQNITVVGDFSQSIYSWRGADIRNLEKFSVDFPGSQLIELEQNYRSTQSILDFAFSVISQNQTHPILKLFTKNNLGKDITFYEAENEEHESLYVCRTIEKLHTDTDYSNMAVLYRTNAQSRVIEESFLHLGIPYVLIGGQRFYARKEIKDILSYLRLLIQPEDTVALDRVKKIGKRRFEAFRSLYSEMQGQIDTMSTIDLIEMLLQRTGYLDLFDADVPEEYARLENIRELKSVAITHNNLVAFLEQISLVESEYFKGEKVNGESNGVKLMTLHQAKGLEFDYVFIVGLEEGILPHSRSVDDLNQLEEERRLFYVGITRARKELFITNARRRFIFGRRNDALRSRFIHQEDEIIVEEYETNDDWW